MHVDIAGKATDGQRVGSIQHFGRAVIFQNGARLSGDLEDHAGGAAHVEPAVVTGHLHRNALILIIRIDRAQHIQRGNLAAPDGSDRVFHILLRQTMQHGLQRFPGEGLAGALEGALQNAITEAGILLADRHAGGATNGRTGLARHHHLFPCGRRHLHARADDLHLVAIVEPGHERHDPPVDLGANRCVADIGVHRIGEIDGVAPRGSAISLPLGVKQNT